MADRERTEGFPSLTARKHWGKYAIGMGVEALFILGLTLVGYVLAVIGTAVWK